MLKALPDSVGVRAHELAQPWPFQLCRRHRDFEEVAPTRGQRERPEGCEWLGQPGLMAGSLPIARPIEILTHIIVSRHVNQECERESGSAARAQLGKGFYSERTKRDAGSLGFTHEGSVRGGMLC